jgi:hypothetical protein
MLTGKSLLAILASILRIFEDQSLTLAVRLSRTRNESYLIILPPESQGFFMTPAVPGDKQYYITEEERYQRDQQAIIPYLGD